MTKKVSKYSEGICFCNDIDEIEGIDAQAYCSNHLKKLFVDGQKWQITYICPVTDIQWFEDYPNGEYHGGGSPRLRRLPLNS